MIDAPALAQPQWAAGNRIQLVRPITGVAAGTCGTVLGRFTFDLFYDVCFDGYGAPRLVDKWNLAPAPVDNPTTSPNTPSV